MTYDPRPNPSGDTLESSRNSIRTNFELIQTQFEQNHINISNNGKHKFLQMPFQSSAPAVAAGEVGFYSKQVGGVTQLFLRGDNSGSEYQLTTGTLGVDPNIASFGVNTGTDNGGWTFLPGGIIMQWGFKALPGTSGSITFPRTFPTAIFVITVTAIAASSNTSSSVNGVPGGLAGFDYFTAQSNTLRLQYIAIGK